MLYNVSKGISKNLKTKILNFSAAPAMATVFTTGLALLFLTHIAFASSPSYTQAPFTSSEISTNWSPDRTTPSGGYSSTSFGGRSNVLEMNVDNTHASPSTGFYRTEGLQRQIPNSDTIKADLYVDSSWLTKDVRAGLWGVGKDSGGSVSAYPIIEFTTAGDGGFTGWRVWDGVIGGWTNLPASYNTNAWNTLEISFNESTDQFDLNINGTNATSNTADVTTHIGAVILNSYNYAETSDKDYSVHWSNFAYGTYPPDTSSTTFVNDPKYVRANNGGDLSAQIVTPDTTEDVRFFVDGNTSTPFSASNIGGAGATTSWWRLYTPLPAGQHTISAQVKISGTWYDVSDTGVVYSLDTPWAQYVIPQSNQFFRPNDKVVRVKADDEFDQFNYMKTTVNGVTHTVNRADCSDQGNYVLCDLQNLNLPAGTYQADTTTYTKANNRVDHLMSPEFTIDDTRPELTNFQITHTHSVYGSLVDVSADATDANDIKNVKFYVTAPRASDGVCDGNGTHLVDATGSHTSGDTYTATLDTSSLTGDYCLNAIAEDNAANHSSISKIKATFDNTAPANPTLVSPPNNTVTQGASITQSWSDASSDVDHYIYESYNNSTATSLRYHNTYSATSKTATNVADTTYWWRVKAVDHVGNESDWSPLWKITVDNTAPTGLNNLSPSSGSSGTTASLTSIDWSDATDANGPVTYYYESSRSNATNGDSSFTSPVYQSGALSSSQIPTPGTPEGTYYWHVRAVDAAGNSTDWTTPWEVIVDNTAPDTPSATPPAGDYTGTQSVELSSSDSLSGLASIYYTTNGDTPDNTSTLYTGPISVASDETIKAVAYDNAGNASTVLEAAYGIAPTISGEGSIGVTTTSITLVWTTDQPATSRVIYDTSSHSGLGSAPNYGYAFSTVETDASPKVTTHSVTVTGLTPGTTYYFRTVSHGSPESVSGELASVTKVPPSSGSTTPTYVITPVLGVGTTAGSVINTVTGGAGGIVGNVLGATTTAPNTPNNSAGDGSSSDGNVGVEGTSTKKADTKKASAFLGLGWWWLLVLAIVLGLIYGLTRGANGTDKNSSHS